MNDITSLSERGEYVLRTLDMLNATLDRVEGYIRTSDECSPEAAPVDTYDLNGIMFRLEQLANRADYTANRIAELVGIPSRQEGEKATAERDYEATAKVMALHPSHH